MFVFVLGFFEHIRGGLCFVCASKWAYQSKLITWMCGWTSCSTLDVYPCAEVPGIPWEAGHKGNRLYSTTPLACHRTDHVFSFYLVQEARCHFCIFSNCIGIVHQYTLDTTINLHTSYRILLKVSQLCIPKHFKIIFVSFKLKELTNNTDRWEPFRFLSSNDRKSGRQLDVGAASLELSRGALPEDLAAAAGDWTGGAHSQLGLKAFGEGEGLVLEGGLVSSLDIDDSRICLVRRIIEGWAKGSRSTRSSFTKWADALPAWRPV